MAVTRTMFRSDTAQFGRHVPPAAARSRRYGRECPQWITLFFFLPQGGTMTAMTFVIGRGRTEHMFCR